MTFKIVNEKNIKEEHICCAITEKKGDIVFQVRRRG